MSSNIAVEIEQNLALLSNTKTTKSDTQWDFKVAERPIDKPTKTNFQFDFRVAERPTYKPNSGPPLQPITLIPSHDKDGYIIDCFPYPRPQDASHFLVGFEKERSVQFLVHPRNIRDYVSDFTLEIWEYKRSSEEEDRLVKELQPILIASEKRRKLYSMKKADASRDIIMGLKRKQEDDGQSIVARKRGRAPKSMASVFMPQPPKEPGANHGAGRARKTIASPMRRLSQHTLPSLSLQPSLSQPSLSQAYLSTPSRALLESAIADSDDEDELASSRQLLEEAHQHSGLSSIVASSQSEASSPTPLPSHQGNMSTSHLLTPKKPVKSKFIKKSPHNRPKHTPILPGMSADTYPYRASFSYKNTPQKKYHTLGRSAASKQSSLLFSPTSGKVTFRSNKQTRSVDTTEGKPTSTILPRLKAAGNVSDSRTAAAIKQISTPADPKLTPYFSPGTKNQHSRVESDEVDNTSNDRVAEAVVSPPRNDLHPTPIDRAGFPSAGHVFTSRSRSFETSPDDVDELSQGHYGRAMQPRQVHVKYAKGRPKGQDQKKEVME